MMYDNKSLILTAPAKINLFLHVLGQRHDGYHEIETLFQFLDLADTMKFQLTKDPAIVRRDDHPYLLPQHDLVTRAAKLIKTNGDAKIDGGITITLIKRIPPGSGLGGGSSNATTTLIALNHLWNLRLNRKKLMELGLILGADVPVFLFGQACWATGIGDILEPYPIKQHWYCVSIPQVSVSTQAIFSDPMLKPNHSSLSKESFIENMLGNDLESVTAYLYPQVKETLDFLSQFGPARMSGSGSAVFVQCNSESDAESVCAKLPPHIKGFVCRTTNRHPLLDFGT